jgi:hypothetical protein
LLAHYPCGSELSTELGGDFDAAWIQTITPVISAYTAATTCSEIMQLVHYGCGLNFRPTATTTTITAHTPNPSLQKNVG